MILPPRLYKTQKTYQLTLLFMETHRILPLLTTTNQKTKQQKSLRHHWQLLESQVNQVQSPRVIQLQMAIQSAQLILNLPL